MRVGIVGWWPKKRENYFLINENGCHLFCFLFVCFVIVIITTFILHFDSWKIHNSSPGIVLWRIIPAPFPHVSHTCISFCHIHGINMEFWISFSTDGGPIALFINVRMNKMKFFNLDRFRSEQMKCVLCLVCAPKSYVKSWRVDVWEMRSKLDVSRLCLGSGLCNVAVCGNAGEKYIFASKINAGKSIRIGINWLVRPSEDWLQTTGNEYPF